MNTIVLNTLTGAVSEYDNFDFHGITPTHGGSATGLFAFGGDLDIDQPIIAQVRTPTPLREDTRKKHVSTHYFSMKGAGDFQATVFGESQSWSYSFPGRTSGQARCLTGRGIRENYMGFGFSNPVGQQFQLDRIEVLMHASQRRV